MMNARPSAGKANAAISEKHNIDESKDAKTGLNVVAARSDHGVVARHIRKGVETLAQQVTMEDAHQFEYNQWEFIPPFEHEEDALGERTAMARITAARNEPDHLRIESDGLRGFPLCVTTQIVT